MHREPLTRCEFDSGNLLLKLDVTMPGDIIAVSPIIAKILAVIGEMGCAAGREFEIELALTEALANAIKYGSANDPSKDTVLCRVRSERGIYHRPRPWSRIRSASVPNPIVGQNIFQPIVESIHQSADGSGLL